MITFALIDTVHMLSGGIALAIVVTAFLFLFGEYFRKAKDEVWSAERIEDLVQRICGFLAVLPAALVVYQVIGFFFEYASRNSTWLGWLSWMMGSLIATLMAFSCSWVIVMLVISIPVLIISSFFPKEKPSSNESPAVVPKFNPGYPNHRQLPCMPPAQSLAGSAIPTSPKNNAPPTGKVKAAAAPPKPQGLAHDKVSMPRPPHGLRIQQPSNIPPHAQRNLTSESGNPKQKDSIEPKVPARVTEAIEGKRIPQTSYAVVRDPRLRAEAIAFHGRHCCVCGFSFDKAYGPELAQGYIEIHHLKSVAEGERNTNAHTDLAPLCANCHVMADRLTRTDLIPPTTIAELCARLR